MRLGFKLILGIIIMASLFSCSMLKSKQGVSDYTSSSQFYDEKFNNLAEVQKNDFKKAARIFWRYITETRKDSRPVGDIPVHTLTAEQLIADNQQGTAIYRLGHSSLLLASNGEFWLIDPVFSDRASPMQWAGPQRFHPTPIELAQLPPIKGVIISHDHYDHLDKASIEALADKVDYFITPLGVGDRMRDWGVADNKIKQLDWWQHVDLGQLKLTATPAQHFSGRGMTDANQTLWASWVIKTADKNIFFSGDTGYFDGFKQIGEKLGPFDLTLMENGAYNQEWADIHMSPEQTIQAHLDVQGKAILPIHNGTFDLAMHPWYEPFEEVSELAQAKGIQVVTPEVGIRVSLDELPENSFWWRQVAVENK